MSHRVGKLRGRGRRDNSPESRTESSTVRLLGHLPEWHVDFLLCMGAGVWISGAELEQQEGDTGNFHKDIYTQMTSKLILCS